MEGKRPVEVTFKPKARLMHLLGENLLRDEVTALLELVKNAYDADSPSCIVRFESLKEGHTKIIIEDEGTGMDISTVSTAWAEPGTSFKLRKPVTPKGRRVQGEKGIGRFAVDKLAKRLDMYTKTEGMTDVIHFAVDWEDFDDADRYLEDVKAWYSFEKMEFKKHGTKLILTKLRKSWDLGDVLKVKYGLTRLVPPDRVPEDFVIDLQVPDYPYFGGIIRNDIIEKAPFRITAKLEGDQITATIYRKLPHDKRQIVKSITPHSRKEEISSERLKNLGPIGVDIGAFLRTKRRGRPRRTLFPTVQITEQDAKNLEQWHGVSIYSDGFWIYPYGETWFDWLSLAQRRVQQPGRRFDNDQVVGFVRISRDRNPNLIQQMSREGLVHNESYETLTSVCLSVLSALEADAVASGARKRIKRPTETEVTSSPVTEIVKDSLGEVEKEIKQGIKAVSEGTPQTGVAALQAAVSEIRSLKDEVEKNFIIYERHAILGLFVGYVIHEINMAIDPIRLGINTLENRLFNATIEDAEKEKLFEGLKDMDHDLENLASQVQRWSPFIKRDEPKEKVELCEHVRQLGSDLEKQYPNLKIEVSCNQPVFAEIAENYFWTIIRNLVDNSSYWTAKSQKPLVRLSVGEDANRAIVRVSDNGSGIQPEDRENIFIPGWSSKPFGSGIGLKLAGEAAFVSGGQLVLLHDSEIDKGATFELRIPLVKQDEQ